MSPQGHVGVTPGPCEVLRQAALGQVVCLVVMWGATGGQAGRGVGQGADVGVETGVRAGIGGTLPPILWTSVSPAPKPRLGIVSLPPESSP